MRFISEFKAVSLGRTQGFAVDAAKNYGACASWLGELGGVYFNIEKKCSLQSAEVPFKHLCITDPLTHPLE